MNKMYMDLYNKLVTAYKKGLSINIEIRHCENNRFYSNSFLKISDIHIENEYINIIPEGGGELFIYKKDDISYFENCGRVFSNMFLIKLGDISVIIDTEN